MGARWWWVDSNWFLLCVFNLQTCEATIKRQRFHSIDKWMHEISPAIRFGHRNVRYREHTNEICSRAMQCKARKTSETSASGKWRRERDNIVPIHTLRQPVHGWGSCRRSEQAPNTRNKLQKRQQQHREREKKNTARELCEQTKNKLYIHKSANWNRKQTLLV